MGIETDRPGAARLPARAPAYVPNQNQMCEPKNKVNGKEIVKMFNNWKNNEEEPRQINQTIEKDGRNETGLIPGTRKDFGWTHSDLLHSLESIMTNNSYYIVSNTHLPIISPLKPDNTSNPKITFGKSYFYSAILQ
jgi:hypothetical protein